MDDAEELAEQLNAIIHDIGPEERPLQTGLRPLTEEQRERIITLVLAKKWRKLRKFAKRLEVLRQPLNPASQVLHEWLVQELNANAADD
ncbi:MAG TPA: hypothetical protein VGH84_02735 [Steroidobacteraceae bacterium]|jgi:hypothetical protein